MNDQGAADGALYTTAGDLLTRTGGTGNVLTINLDAVTNLNINLGDGMVHLGDVDPLLNVHVNGQPVA